MVLLFLQSVKGILQEVFSVDSLVNVLVNQLELFHVLCVIIL
jgi:hypothetical protein